MKISGGVGLKNQRVFKGTKVVVAASVLVFLVMIFSPSVPDAEGAPSGVEIDGVVYDLDSPNVGKATVSSRIGGYAGDITIPATVTFEGHAYDVTAVDGSAFKNNLDLTSVTIGKNVTSITDYALSGCTKLLSVSVDSDNTKYSSIDDVLYNKNKTELIQYPGGKTGSFTIPNNVTKTGGYAFASSVELTSVVIPDTLTTLGTYAFQDCAKLTTVTINESSLLTTIPNSSFLNCSKLTSIYIFRVL